MDPIDPAVMFTQAAQLSHDLTRLTGPVTEQITGLLPPGGWTSVDRVYLSGDGDSYHAACAVQWAFTSLAGIDCHAISAQHLLSYPPNLSTRGPERRALVIGISASGTTKRVQQLLTQARERGALTVAVTGRPGSPVTQEAEHSLIVELTQNQPSPGIRTYQASLLGLLLIAVHLSSHRSGGPVAAPKLLRAEILALADRIEATSHAAAQHCPALVKTIAHAPAMTLLGSGPSHGTALFAAAKIIEAASIFAVGQDLEEWSHVERFARPYTMPLFLIAPPGPTHPRAVQVARHARSLGRYVIAVTTADDDDLTMHAHTVLPVHGHPREEFSPLLYGLFAAHLAGGLAQHLKRQPFQDTPITRD